MAYEEPKLTFWTQVGCGPCSAIKPTFLNMQSEPDFQGVIFEEKQLLDNQEEAEIYGIDGVPTFVLTGLGQSVKLVNPGADALRQATRDYLKSAGSLPDPKQSAATSVGTHLQKNKIWYIAAGAVLLLLLIKLYSKDK